MTNKQVIMLFGAGTLLLLVAFWAGMSLTPQGGAEATTQPAQSNGSPLPAAQVPPVQTGSQTPNQYREDPSARYLVVVGIFGTEEKAKELMAALRRQNYRSTHIATAATGSGDKRYRVMIGPYNDRKAADQVAEELTADGRKGIKIEPASN
jgi:cell division septation protein DedD